MNTSIVVDDLKLERYQLALEAIRDLTHTRRCKTKAVPLYECSCLEKSQAQIACEALGTHIPETVVCPRCQT